ncbi:MAG: Uma2 family endonuclease [Gemmataceae bacterium]
MATATLPPPPTALPADALAEVVDGVIVEKIVSIGSQWIASRLHTRLDQFVEDHRLGIVVTEGVFVLEPDDQLKRRPDVAFVSADRWPVDTDPPMEGDWEVIPDLAVEVVSPHDTANAVAEKVREYFDHGVREVWVIYPVTREVYVHGSGESFRVVGLAGALETPLVPGWRLPLATLFRTPAAQ